jgi:acid phosphatase
MLVLPIDKDHEFRRLAMGRLLSEMSEGMHALANGTVAARIRVLACHDTTLAGLCTTLDVFNNRWVSPLETTI